MIKYSSKIFGQQLVSQEILDFFKLQEEPIPKNRNLLTATIKTTKSDNEVIDMKKGGPGTELHNLLEQLGFRLDPKNLSCGCQSMIDKMNRWGVEGCKKENNRKEILEHLNKQKHLTPLGEKLKAGFKAITQGLPKTVENLLDEAIKKADAKK